jgi:hypothetical protein
VRAAQVGIANARGYIAAARRRGDATAARTGNRQLRRARHRLATLPAPCPAATLRTVIVGAAGPLATSVRLTTPDGTALRQDVAPRDGGLFLFVLTRVPRAGSVEIRASYPDGRQCLLPDPTGPHRLAQPRGCAPLPGFVYRQRKRAKPLRWGRLVCSDTRRCDCSAAVHC